MRSFLENVIKREKAKMREIILRHQTRVGKNEKRQYERNYSDKIVEFFGLTKPKKNNFKARNLRK